MPNHLHCGLYFTTEHIQQAQKYRDHEPFKTAWAFFDQANAPSRGKIERDVLWPALHYRLNNQHQAGEKSILALENEINREMSENHFEALTSAVMLAHTFELVRDHPTFSPDAQSRWLTRFVQRVDQLNSTAEMVDLKAVLPDTMSGMRFVEHIWLGLLNIVAGIVLEDDARFESGATIYRHIIEYHIRPEGYLPRAVEGEDGGSLERQLLSVAALVLMAEAAKQVGIDLWNYASRGISIITAASYCIYFYYYPDQWRWDTTSEEQSKALYQELGGFLEIVNAHARPKDIKLMFEEMRPFYNPFAGGLTTLTHALPPKRGVFG